MTPIGRYLEQIVEDLGFSDFEGFRLLYDTATSAFGAVLLAILAYLLIHAGQVRAARDTRRIERARLLHDLDREYHDLMATRCLLISQDKPPVRVPEQDLWNLEYALTREVRWRSSLEMKPDGDSRAYAYINTSRFVRIADNAYIDTLTLHRVVGWFKRIAQAMAADILDRRDVAGIWRNVLPWAKNNRFTYLTLFFGLSRTDRVADHWPDRRRGKRPLLRTPEWRPGWHPDLEPEPDPVWSSDIRPVYRVIHAVIDTAVRDELAEPLDHACVLKGREPPTNDGLDPMVRARLFRQT
ncbi:hypothetical protein [Brevundimonas sp.]|uniref:hypothetical protein n=1 Tax=Brevundimonas sp. TaxID=1871086 RepID=UPI003918952E